MKTKRNFDDWFDIIAGTIISFLFIIPFFLYVFIYFKIEIIQIYLTVPLVYTIYEQWKSNHFSEFTTEFTAKENLEILEIVLAKLKWNHYISYGEIKIEKNNFFLLSLDITFQVRSKKIYYNFGYENLIRGGRLTFLFGIATIQKHYFLYRLKKVITAQ